MAWFLGWIFRLQNVAEIRVLSPVHAQTTQNTKSALHHPKIAEKVAKVASLQPNLTPEQLDKVINLISECESGRRTSIIHTDIDGLKVYGAWQFKWKTFEAAVKKFGFRNEITLEDILNPSLQREVVKALLKDDPNNWKLWYFCGKLLNFDKVKSWN